MKRTLLAFSLAIFPAVAFATHVPSGSEVVSYDGALKPGVAATGAIGWTDPKDGYDWFCLNVKKGQPVSFAAKRTSGNIKLNIGFLQGVTSKDTDTVSTLKVVTETSNSTTSDVNLSVTPTFDGPATIWVSTWLGEDGGNYTVTMTGGDLAPSSCGGASVTPPPGASSTIIVGVPTDPQLVTSSASTVIPITISTQNGFADDVNLSVTGMPDGVTATFDNGTLKNPGSGNANLTLSANGSVLPGTYFITVIGSAANGTDIGASTFSYVVDCAPPYILGINQPASTSVSSGSTAQINVTADGTGPLSYQWYEGIPGVTTAPITNANTSALTTGSIRGQHMFWVRVSNACGSVDSQGATVTAK
ncbi:MAG TPA: hypothetical protein VI391_06285 [Thermoanaerobaculia bacterium]